MMKLIYCILAYDEPQLLQRTVKKLRGEDVLFIIHVQKSVNIKPFLIEGEDVIFIPEDERIETIWGDITCVKAALLLFSTAMSMVSNEEKGYCILMSGTDYPVKSNKYIMSYFEKNWPSDYYSASWIDDSKKNPLYKIATQNCSDYWISYPMTKIKMWIRPLRFVLPRCVKNQNILKALPNILSSLPTITRYFFTKKQYNPYKDLFNGKGFYTSETWMELTFPSVRYLIAYKNDKLFKRAESMHNPEEFMFANILMSRENSNNRREKLVSTMHVDVKGTMELCDDDVEYIDDLVHNLDILYSRKFHEKSCSELFNNIDKYDIDSG